MTQSEFSYEHKHLDGQAAEILAALKAGEAITPLEALERWGVFRLGARVWQLKKDGYNIITEMVKANGKRFACYRLAA